MKKLTSICSKIIAMLVLIITLSGGNLYAKSKKDTTPPKSFTPVVTNITSNSISIKCATTDNVTKSSNLKYYYSRSNGKKFTTKARKGEYTYPELKLFRVISLHQLNSLDNVFISNTPLPCYTIYISEKLLFKTFSINGELIYNEKEEESTGIKCPIIFKNLQFNDFLIYGTENGFIKIRSFPDMKLINSIKPSEDQEIKALELSPL